MPHLALLALIALAACGAEGPPQPPGRVTVTGTASMGVVTKG